MGTEDLRRIRQQALALDEVDRADLAYDLLDTLDQGPANEVDVAWLDEAEKRLAGLDAGRTETVPVEGILEDIEKRLL